MGFVDYLDMAGRKKTVAAMIINPDIETTFHADGSITFTNTKDGKTTRWAKHEDGGVVAESEAPAPPSASTPESEEEPAPAPTDKPEWMCGHGDCQRKRPRYKGRYMNRLCTIHARRRQKGLPMDAPIQEFNGAIFAPVEGKDPSICRYKDCQNARTGRASLCAFHVRRRIEKRDMDAPRYTRKPKAPSDAT